MSSYEVTVEWLPRQQVELHETARRYDLWHEAEARRKWRTAETIFTLTGEDDLTKELADRAREKYKLQWEADGHKFIGATFKRLENL